MTIKVNVEGLTNMEVAKQVLAQAISQATKPTDLIQGHFDIVFSGENNEIETDEVHRLIDDLIYHGNDNIFEDLVRSVAPELTDEEVAVVLEAADDLDVGNNGIGYIQNLDTLITFLNKVRI